MFDDFIERFEKKEQDVFVLVKSCLGAGHNKDFLEMIVLSYAMVFCDNGLLNKEEATLKWPIKQADLHTNLGFNRLKQEHIYKLKVRKLLDSKIPVGVNKNTINCYYVVSVLDENPTCKELEDILHEYQQKVVYKDDILGELVLNREFDWLEANVPWGQETVSLTVSVNTLDRDSWSKSLTVARNMISKATMWDEIMRKRAAKELIELANEWADDSDNEQDIISEDSFAKRIAIESISFTDSEFTAYYSDDDMFYGHSIEIFGDLNNGVCSCNIIG